MMSTGAAGSGSGSSTYFTGLARSYADFRPSYPATTIDAILDGLPRPAQAADIGCGTGISTRLLAQGGAHVIGLDSNADMIAEAGREPQAAPGSIEYRVAKAERTGLDDASVDLVLCAQAFHWFDAEAAQREFHRIIRPSGRLALMWNIRDDREPFTAGYSDIAIRSQNDAAKRGLIVHSERAPNMAWGAWFGNPRALAFDNPQLLDLEGVLGRARSASYFPRSGPLREQFERELHTLFEANQRGGQVTLHHRTELTLVDRVNR